MALSLIEQYEQETGKSAWQVKNYTHTEEYVQWIKSYVKNSDSTAAKMVRSFAKKINDRKS